MATIAVHRVVLIGLVAGLGVPAPAVLAAGQRTTRVDVDEAGRLVEPTASSSSVGGPLLSDDGLRVSFNGQRVWVRDRVTGAVRQADLGADDRPLHQFAGAGDFTDLSADGGSVAFATALREVVPGDTEQQCRNDEEGSRRCEPVQDVFVRDLERGTTSRVSQRADGTGGDRDSSFPQVVRGGAVVAFSSRATNFAAGAGGPGEGGLQAYVRDARTGVVELVSRAPTGAPASGDVVVRDVTPDGRHVLFTTFGPTSLGPGTIFVRDRARDRTRPAELTDGDRAREGRGGGGIAAISANGRRVAFTSATALVPRDTNRQQDVFVRDLRAGTTRRVSVRADGRQASRPSGCASLSADGRRVVFVSSDRLVASDSGTDTDVFERDLARGRTRRIDLGLRRRDGRPGSTSCPVLYGDGRWLAFITNRPQVGRARRCDAAVWLRGPCGSSLGQESDTAPWCLTDLPSGVVVIVPSCHRRWAPTRADGGRNDPHPDRRA